MGKRLTKAALEAALKRAIEEQHLAEENHRALFQQYEVAETGRKAALALLDKRDAELKVLKRETIDLALESLELIRLQERTQAAMKSALDLGQKAAARAEESTERALATENQLAGALMAAESFAAGLAGPKGE